MNRFRNTNIVKIPYREGKISKQLSLNLNNEHDARFYESYDKIPLDNRNYLASLYAREQERGVNDDVGQRLQDLALATPKEDIVITRERRKYDIESLEQSVKQYDQKIAEIKANSMGAELTNEEKVQIAELEKIRDDIKRRIRNLKSAALKSETEEFIRKNITNAPKPLTKNGLLDSLDVVAASLSKEVVAFLEDKIAKLPANAGENGTEQYTITNAGFLAALCQQIGIDDMSKLGDALKRFYSLLLTINKDTLTQDIYDNNYKDSVDFINDSLERLERLDVPDFLNDTKAEIVIDQIDIIVLNIKAALGRAAYNAYNEADRRFLPNWNNIKAILDGSGFKKIYDVGNEVNTFRKSDAYNDAKRPYTVLRDAIKSTANEIWTKWNNIPSANSARNRSFMDAVIRLNDKKYVGKITFKKRGYAISRPYETVALTVHYDIDNNTLTITSIDIADTNLSTQLANVSFDNWINKRRTYRVEDKKVYRLTLTSDVFANTAADAILRELRIDEQDELPPEITRKLVGAGTASCAAAQYRNFNSPEQQFHNIIDMGNPLKEIRSRYHRK